MFLVLLAGIVFASCSTQVMTPNASEPLSAMATDLNVPWEMAFLPDGSMLVTERPGQIQHFNPDGTTTASTIMQVQAIGEGGLLGLVLHPNFATNRYVYVYYTTGTPLKNQVSRFTFANEVFTDETVIVDNIPAASNHDGGRIKFGPDGFLYITTGDANNPELAQDTNSLAGKILRVTDTGQAAPGNPFQNLVYSYGHRNPEGLAWDNQGRLWSTEHGPSAHDELNLIEAGKNYGWPVIRGEQTREGMAAPVIQSGQDTWAPAGLAFYEGKFYFGGLRGTALFIFDPDNNQLTSSLEGKYGRLRAVSIYEGDLIVSTSNRDGRGQVQPQDDKILRIDPRTIAVEQGEEN